MTQRALKNQGMNWIRPEKRLAIYQRDGLACCYCGHSVEAGAKLTLDHLTPYSKGGSNEPTNLVTACFSCNSARGARSWTSFASSVAAYLNISLTAITKSIENSRRRTINVEAARQTIALRGGFTNSLRSAA